MARNKSERKILEHFFECRRYSRAIKYAKDCMTNIQQSLDMETNISLLENKTTAWSTIWRLRRIRLPTWLRTGWRYYPSSTTHSSSSSRWQPSSGWKSIEAGIRGKHHPGLNSNFFFFFVQRCHFACRKFNLLAIDRGCRQTRLPRTTLSHAQSLHRLVLLVVRVYSHALTSMHLHGSRLKRIFVYHLKTLHPRRAMPYTLQNLTPRTSTPSTPFPEPVFQHSKHPCQDQRPQQRGALTETPPLTWNEGMYRDAFTAELKQASDTLARSSTMESTVSPPSVVKN